MTSLLRPGLALLAAVEVALGLWTLLFPASFYADVPTVDATPPFSEHLFRDFGGATLGLAVVLTAAAVWPERRLVVTALLAYLAFSAPHLVFHLGHLPGCGRDGGHGAGRRPHRLGGAAAGAARPRPAPATAGEVHGNVRPSRHERLRQRYRLRRVDGLSRASAC